MTNQQMLTQLRGLPSEDQYKIAVTILDELAVKGQLPLSEAARNLLDERIEEADKNPDSLIPAKDVFDELGR